MPESDDDKTRIHLPLTGGATRIVWIWKVHISDFEAPKSGHNLVTIGCKSLCHNASMGFDSPTSILLCHNHLQELLGLYPPITPNNVTPF